MSNIRNIRDATIAGVGTAFAFGALSIPEKWRGKVPEEFDLASTASSITTGMALGVVAVRLAEKMKESSRNRVLIASLALSTCVNGAAENPQINAFLTPPEMNVVLGHGYGGEFRDFVYGVLATGLTTALTYRKQHEKGIITVDSSTSETTSR